MRIVLSMVGISLGIVIAIVAGVYGWQRYEESKPLPVPESVAALPEPTATPEPATAPITPKPTSGGLSAPAPTHQPTTAPPPPAVAPPTSPKPGVPPLSVPPANPPMQVPPPAPTQPPGTLAGSPGMVKAEDRPIAEPLAPEVATPDKLDALQIGMTEGDVRQTMGAEGVDTPVEQLPDFTPQGWYEVRWANADGSYIAALFNEQQTLVHVLPFNMPGAYAWLATPHYAVPAWLNDKLQLNNMPVRLPAVDVVEPQQYTYQFRGPLVDAAGTTVGSISGTYYLGEAAGQYARAIEGSYEYRLSDGRIDANTFQFTE